MELNGVEGLGYNERFKQPKKNECVEWLNNLTKSAIFGKKAPNYSSQYQAFLDSGKFHKDTPRHFRKKMLALELDRFLHRVLNRIKDDPEDSDEE